MKNMWTYGDEIRTVGIDTVISMVRRSYYSSNTHYRVEIKNSDNSYLQLPVRESRLIELYIVSENRTGDGDAIFDPSYIANMRFSTQDSRKLLENELEYIIKTYSNKEFLETFKETIYTGRREETDNGEVVEQVNTDEKVIITYTMK